MLTSGLLYRFVALRLLVAKKTVNDTSFLKKTSQDPAADSAGIGRWGLMGWGAHGWDGLSGPVAFSARSLEQLGWISAADGRLLSVERDREDLIANDLFSGGAVYKIPLRAETPLEFNS